MVKLTMDLAVELTVELRSKALLPGAEHSSRSDNVV
jgi:hypothetical protein